MRKIDAVFVVDTQSIKYSATDFNSGVAELLAISQNKVQSKLRINPAFSRWGLDSNPVLIRFVLSSGRLVKPSFKVLHNCFRVRLDIAAAFTTYVEGDLALSLAIISFARQRNDLHLEQAMNLLLRFGVEDLWVGGIGFKFAVEAHARAYPHSKAVPHQSNLVPRFNSHNTLLVAH